jgi:hypothetical protein
LWLAFFRPLACIAHKSLEIFERCRLKVGPRNGARVVARAWVDPAYKERLLTDATPAIGELGCRRQEPTYEWRP